MIGLSLLPNRMRFATMWKYYFDDSFQGAKAYTKWQEVSGNLEFVTNNTTNVCFEFWCKNFDVGAQIGGGT